MVGLAVDADGVALLAHHALHHSDFLVHGFKHSTLLDVELEKRGDVFRRPRC